MYIESSSGITFESSTFADIANANQGGGAYITNSVVTFTGNTFRDSHSREGIIYATSSANITLNNDMFTDNQADQTACITISDSATVTTNACTFTGNSGNRAATLGVAPSGKILDSKFSDSKYYRCINIRK